MQTQKDRLNAYQFLMGRMSSALAAGDPNIAEPADRRPWFGLLGGLAIGVLVGIGFWVYGLISPGSNTAWQQKGAILVEKETGARYVYLDGVLRPTLNQASALLLQGPGSSIRTISKSSLKGLPHGAPIGIEGAPDVLPARRDLVGGPWLLCLNGRPGQAATMSMVLEPRRTPGLLGADRFVVVSSSGGQRYVVFGGVKHRLATAAESASLGLSMSRPSTAPDAWLHALPDGPTLAAADIPEFGRQGPKVGDRAGKVGQLYRQLLENGGVQLFVLRTDGLAPLTATEFALLEAKSVVEPISVSASDVAATPHSGDSTLLDRLPDIAMAQQADLGTNVVCLAQQATGADVVTGIVVVPASEAGTPMDAFVGATVKPNRGMLAVAIPLPAPPRAPNRYLITDRGIRYLLPDNAAVNSLGFAGVEPIAVADDVLAMLPAGPVLSREAVGLKETS